jgi:four helix bundle protein
MKIEKFEDLNAWKEARVLYRMVIEATNSPRTMKDLAFVAQIRSAALSVMANIAEGFESLTNKESLSFLNFARRSCGEVRSHLYAGVDVHYFSEEAFRNLYSQVTKTGKIITGFMAYLRTRK